MTRAQRLTTRGQIVVTAVTCLAFMGSLLIASHYGEDSRCRRLHAAHSPNADLYCGTSTTSTGEAGEGEAPTSPVVASSARPKLPLRTEAPKASRSRQLVSTGTGSLHLNWHALAECESSNNPHAISPSGTYRGLYQFDLTTWASVGGTGDPAAASRNEQTLRAQLLYNARGASPWPICGRHL